MKVKLKIKEKDTVQVISGKELGKRGKVLRVYPEKNRVLVEKVNFVHKHQKQKQQGQPSGIMQIEAALNISNVMVVCPSCNTPARLGFQVLEDGKHSRFCKNCESTID